MKEYKKILLLIPILVIFGIVISIVMQSIDLLILNIDKLKEVSIDTWITFAGSILGGLLTMLGVYFTLMYSKNEYKNEKIKEIRPYIICMPELKEDSYVPNIENNSVFQTIPLTVKNISNNLVKDLRYVYQEVYIYDEETNSYKELNEDSKYNILLELLDTKEFIDPHDSISYHINFIINNYDKTSSEAAHNFIIKSKLIYNDILDIVEYTHYLEFNLTINYVYKKGEYIIFYNDLTNKTIKKRRLN